MLDAGCAGILYKPRTCQEMLINEEKSPEIEEKSWTKLHVLIIRSNLTSWIAQELVLIVQLKGIEEGN